MHLLSIFVAALAADATLAMAHPQVLKRTSVFQYFGSSESGAEFGSAIPGTKDKDYTWPKQSSIDTLVGKGFNIFRIPFLMERLVPNQLTGGFDSSYLSDLTNTVNYITKTKGVYAVIDPHNYGRYYGNIITDTSGFETWWKNVAGQFKSNSKVLFDTNNEYHDMDSSLVLSLNQAAINGIRAAGATSQTILVEGNSWSGASSWASVNDNLKTLSDPSNKIVYEMHQYLDSDGSGTSSVCASSTVGADRIASATQWLKANGKKGIIGEFAGGNNSQCIQALTGMLESMKKNTDVWTGAIWWAAGPWWGSYMFSMEPPSGVAYTNILPSLMPYI